MSAKRPPAPPPEIPGYNYISLLGSGGFADVFLYEQDRPRRRVAVKVLISDLKTEGARRRFESEANLMAQLSSHPYIVTIYEAEVTAAGHSYLAMEYCSRPSLDVRYRRARFSVDEVLAVGVQVSSAVETAHRAGIVHRDIKPANILVTDYNRPALTDFGISATMDSSDEDDAGMSIPWSPPESFSGRNVDGVKVDVWALGATLYTLLAGRSPFVIPGADNSQRELINRISSAPLPRLGRADVPEALELVLATAMAKSPGSRYASAQDFARALQRVQTELGLSMTPFEVQEDVHLEERTPEEDNTEETRIRSVVSIDPDATTGKSFNGRTGARFPAMEWGSTADRAGTIDRNPTADSIPTTAREAQTSLPSFTQGPSISAVPGVNAARAQQGFLAAPPTWTQSPGAEPEEALAQTVNRPVAAPPETPSEPEKSAGKARLLWSVIGGVVIVAAVVIAIVMVNLGGAPQGNPKASITVSQTPSGINFGKQVPMVTNLKSTPGDGGSNWSWKNPDPQDGDKYQYASVSQLSTDPDFKIITTPAVFVADNNQGKSCISVILIRKDGSSSEEAKKCSP
ncbi:serine/threonine protein kinase [Psychromicrobium silvestre]|uniref:non-specific serine/threonine protein kinase n=1 Tax=Psychromicrobium silvestre TaxID=1645614 RepID=A0A7Y9LW07_9MICC|nr:serine/threonine protein kinase [Psychromicrobium silvestre]